MAQYTAHLRKELGFREARYRRLQSGRRDFGFHLLETCDGFLELLFFRLGVEEVGRSGFENSTPAEGNHGLAAGQSLHDSEAKILLARNDVGPAAGVQIAQLGIRYAAAKLDVWLSHAFQARVFRTISDYAKLSSCFGKEADSQIDALVSNQLGNDEVVILRFLPEKCLDSDRRINHFRFAAIASPNAASHVLTVSNELVYAGGGGVIPKAQIICQRGHHRPFPARTGPFVQVGGVEIPEITHGRFAIAHVARGGGYEHTFRGAGFAADHQVVPTQVEVLESDGHEGEQCTVMPAQGVEEGRCNIALANRGADAFGIVKQGEKVGLGQQAAEGFQHRFPAAHVQQPIMNDGHTHNVSNILQPAPAKAYSRAVKWSKMDPFLRETPLEHRCLHYPLGFALQLKTNSAEALEIAEATWGGRPQAFEKSPLEVRLIVEPGGGHPPKPVYRAQAHLMSIVSDRENFAVCDYSRKFAFCRLNAAAINDRSFVSYYFLEAIANFTLTQLYLTPVHAACVALKGQGVLLSGASGAGKTTLAYFCAKKGWTYVSDNESWLVRAGGRTLLGNPRRIRFRESAVELFPELKSQQPSPHPNGKMSIELSPEGLDTAYQCGVERVVFLARQAGAPTTLRRVPNGDALEYFIAELPLYEDWVREEQHISLNRIADLNPVELRYSDLESAWRALESLVT